MTLPARVQTVVVGAGQAGLTMSWWLREGGREHVLLERRARLGGGWLDRWDTFRLVSPNWLASFPGYEYDGTDPGGFMPRDEIAGRVARYGEVIDAPIQLETDVLRLAPRSDGGFRLQTNQGILDAHEVVVATGSFQRPRIPAIGAALPDRVYQVHSHDYRRERDLPDGGVLVVGSGQSGVQLAEELHEAGRHVFLSVGTAGRMPRRYRGQDIFHWLLELANRGAEFGAPLPTVDRLPDPRMRFAGNPHLSGHRGGHDTNLRRMAADGITLLGRLEEVAGEHVKVGSDLAANLTWADRFFDERLKPGIDMFIDRAGVDAPPDDREPFDYQPAEIADLDLRAAGISTVLWTSGYRRDYSWIDLPIVDTEGHPRQKRGVTDVPGLYFLGLLWQHNQLSATLGVGADAAYLAQVMGLVRETDLVSMTERAR